MIGRLYHVAIAVKDLKKRARANRIKERLEYVRTKDINTLDKGINATFSVHGDNKDKLKLTWIGIDRVTAYNLHQNIRNPAGMGEEMEKLGFRKFEYSDGFYESYTTELHPLSDKKYIDELLQQKGMDFELAIAAIGQEH